MMMLSTMLREQYALRFRSYIASLWWIVFWLVSVAHSAFAADCDMRLSVTAVSYGLLTRDEMSIRGNEPIDLGRRKLTFRAICNEAQSISLRFEGEAADPSGYRFAGKGMFSLKLSNATLDGSAVQLVQAVSVLGDPSRVANTIDLRPNERVIAISQGRRAVGKVFSATVEVRAYIDDASMQSRDISTLEGDGNLILEAQ